MTALGSAIFAGGFTLGVRESFEVLAHLEETKYGVATVRHNLPELPVYVGKQAWPLDALRSRQIDLLYGNPACSAWSVAGRCVVQGADWRLDPRVEQTKTHFKLLEALRPRAWAWESVTQAFTTGRELVDELTRRALDLGYSVTYLLHDARYLGVPQRRKRFMMVCTDCRFDVEDPVYEELSAAEALRGLNDPGEPLDHNVRKYPDLLAKVKPGEMLRVAWEREHPEGERKLNARGQVVGRPALSINRCPADGPSSVVMHEKLHPTEDRALSVKELALLCGYPRDYEFIGARDAGQVGRGVCPPVGAWLARNVARSLELNEREAPTVRLIDVARPPGARTTLSDPRHAQPREVHQVTLEATQSAVPAPGEGQRSGAYIRQLLTSGFEAEKILELVHEHYPQSRVSKADVAYQRAWLKRGGRPGAAPQAEVVERQPLRTQERASNDPDRTMDKSSLRASSHGQWVHRDYLAHAFRWAFAGRFVTNETEVLDVGCGPDCAMINVLTMPRNQVPRRYVGVDLNREPRSHPSRQWADLKWEFNFLERYRELGQFDLVTNFEMIEHMYKPDGLRLLEGLRECVKPEGKILLSTPVFNGKAASNHLHEFYVDELRTIIHLCGLTVEDRFGTFSSKNEIFKALTDPEKEIYLKLERYYSSEVLSCFLAPIYPDYARNNIWILKRS